MKRYGLLKDLPYAKSGCIFRWHKMTGGYAQIKIPNKSYEDDMRMSLSKEYVENNPEWFEPIPDTPEQTTEIEKLKNELRVTEQLLEERQRVLDAIPQCPEHGGNCVPHAIEWIKERINTQQTTKEGLWSDEDMIEFAKGAVKVQHSLPNEVSIERGFYHFKKEKAHKQSLSNTLKEELLDLANPNPKYSFSPSYQPKEEKTYTQEQLDKAIEETWKAARKLDEWDYHHTPYQYRTLADYLSSIKKQ